MNPYGIDVSGELVVVSSGIAPEGMLAFDRDGNLLATWGGSGSGPGEFTYAEGVHIDPFGRILVADNGNARIQAFGAPVAPEALIGELRDELQLLVADGTMLPANGNSLERILDSALAALDRDHVLAAQNKLLAFVNKVEALVKSRRLDAETGADLIAAAMEAWEALNDQ